MTRQAKRRSVPERGWLPIHPTHYERLGVTEAADTTEIGDTISRALAKATPLALAEAPDAQVPQNDRDWQLACEVLADPLRREVYDRYLARERGQLTTGDRPPQSRRRRLLLTGAAIGGALALMWLVLASTGGTGRIPGGSGESGSGAASGAPGASGVRASPAAPRAS
jgi:DnaJ-class molecular chaperone